MALLLCVVNIPCNAYITDVFQKHNNGWLLNSELLKFEMQYDVNEGEISLPHPNGKLLPYYYKRIHVSNFAKLNNISTFSLRQKINNDSEKLTAVYTGRLTIYNGQLKAYIYTDINTIFIQAETNDNQNRPLNNSLNKPLLYRSFSRQEKSQLKSFNALKNALEIRDNNVENNQIIHSDSFNQTHLNCLTDHKNHDASTQNLSTQFGIRSNRYINPMANNQIAKKFGETIRIYRLALSATHEYNQRVGFGNKTKTYAEMVHAVSRINAIFERNFSIRLELVSSEELIADTATTFSEGNVVEMLGENQKFIDNVVGINNYDIGHVLGISGGGIASLASACSSRKAQGVSANASPTSSIFYVDYLAHELAHQLSATHTFNAGGQQSGSCQDNRVASGEGIFESSAYEVGSGSTIMGYAGLCSQQNTQYSADEYFHAKSIEQVRKFSQGLISAYDGSCGRTINTFNNPPNVNAGAAYIIPTGTPFTLTAEGFDPENDSITYTWEQYDLGESSISRNDMHRDQGFGPLIRSVTGSSNASRTIPPRTDILLGDFMRTYGVRLPTFSRDLNFRVTARSGGYGVNQDDVKISVVRTQQPFSLVQPNGIVTLSSNQKTLVSWITGETQNSPIACDSVNILLSTNNGEKFTYTLATNTPNDGNEKVLLPNLTSQSARVRIECSNNIFFSVSDTSFAIQAAIKPILDIRSSHLELNEGNANEANISFTYTVSISEPLGSDLEISYAVFNAGKQINISGVSNANTVAADDFFYLGQQLPKGKLIFKAGETEKTFSVEISADNTEEFDEYFQVIIDKNPIVDFSTRHALSKIISEEKPEYLQAILDSNDNPAATKARDLSSGYFSWGSLIIMLVFFVSRRMLNRGSLSVLC